jgi:hypothetical protein
VKEIPLFALKAGFAPIKAERIKEFCAHRGLTVQGYKS